MLAPESSAKLISANDLYEHVFFYETLNAYAIGSGFLSPEATNYVTVPFDQEDRFDIGYVVMNSSRLSDICSYMIGRAKDILSAFEGAL